jgi:hypothetical protein
VYRTSGVRDFETSEDLGCSVIERPKRPKGRNHVASLQDFGSLRLRKISCIDSKEAFSTEVPNFLLACVLDEDRVRSWDRTVDGHPPWMKELGDNTREVDAMWPSTNEHPKNFGKP